MSEACAIDFQGVRYFFDNKNDEIPELFVKRCWYKVKNKNKYAENILEMLSHIWINEKFLGMTYDDSYKSVL